MTALHNARAGIPADGKSWPSYSFLIEGDARRLVFSDDLKSVRELGPFLDECDLLLMETGHHKVEDVCAYLMEIDRRVGRVGFIHHGMAVLGDPEGELQKARAILGDRVFVADDGTSLDL